MSSIPLGASLGQLREAISAATAIVNGPSALFVVTGRIAIPFAWGVITENVENIAVTAKLTGSQGGQEVSLCQPASVQAFTSANRVWMTNDPADALAVNSGVAALRTHYGYAFVEGPGYIWMRGNAAPATGKIRWYLNWLALSSDATVVLYT